MKNRYSTLAALVALSCLEPLAAAPNFLPRVHYPIPGTSVGQSLAVGDLNGDGRQDFVVAAYDVGAATTDPRIGRIHVGLAGAGGVLQFAPLDDSGMPVQKLRLAHLNDDGFLDLVILRQGGTPLRRSALAWRAGLGDGAFDDEVTLSAIDGVYFAMMGTVDVNADGVTDVAVVRSSQFNSSIWQVFINDGAAGFAPGPQGGPEFIGFTASWEAPAFFDYDQDGRVDLLTLDDWAYGGISGVKSGDGNGQFATTVAFPAALAGSFGWVALDFDADGMSDLLATRFANDGAYTCVLRGLGGSAYQGIAGPCQRLLFSSPLAVQLDGEGPLEVIDTADQYNNAVVLDNIELQYPVLAHNRMMSVDGNGAVLNHPTFIGGMSTVVVDVDGDGRLDLVGLGVDAEAAFLVVRHGTAAPNAAPASKEFEYDARDRQPFNGDCSTTDPDDNALNYDLRDWPTKGGFSYATGPCEFSFVPNEEATGTQKLVFDVSDGVATAVVTVTIRLPDGGGGAADFAMILAGGLLGALRRRRARAGT